MKKQIKVKTQSRPELRIPTGTFEAEFMSNQPYGTLYAIWGMQICYQCQVLAKGLFDAKIEEWILEL